MTTPLHWLTADSLGRMLRSGECSSVDATEAILQRIERLNPSLNAFVRVEVEAARAAAQQADRELRDGKDHGPLHGIPIAVKDLCQVRGLPTAAGTQVMRDRIAAEDACVVARLRQAGAVLLGTLQMTEAAYSNHHPAVRPPRNPWNPDRWPGISSSGPGVATAAGLCFGSLGTDTGGSIRFPSAANGLVGIKPTHGRVPLHGIFPLAASLDHVGPLARSVRDAASLLTVIAGFDPRDPTSLRAPVPDYAASLEGGLRGARIGIDESYAREGLDPEIIDPILAGVSVLRDAGAEIRAVRLPPWQDLILPWVIICGAEAALAHEGMFPQRRAEYGPELAHFLDGGLARSAVDLARADAVRREFSGRLQGVFEEVDLLLCPTLGIPVPPPVPDFGDPGIVHLSRFTMPFDLSGSPTISLPCGFSADGLPLSLQLVGRHLEEELLCRAGRTFERATTWHERHPAM